MSNQTQNNHYPVFGIFLVIGFTIIGPIMDTFAKLASNEIPIGQISFSRFLVQSFIIVPIAFYLKIVYVPNLFEILLHFIRAFFILVAIWSALSTKLIQGDIVEEPKYITENNLKIDLGLFFGHFFVVL